MKYIYSAFTPKRFKMVLLVIRQTILTEILNLEGHPNCCISSKVTAIWLNGWILPTGGVPSGRVCPAACAAGLLMSKLTFLSTLLSKITLFSFFLFNFLSWALSKVTFGFLGIFSFPFKSFFEPFFSPYSRLLVSWCAKKGVILSLACHDNFLFLLFSRVFCLFGVLEPAYCGLAYCR